MKNENFEDGYYWIICDDELVVARYDKDVNAWWGINWDLPIEPERVIERIVEPKID